MQSSSVLPPPLADRQGGPTDPSHDERLRRGILFTDVQRGVAWLLVGAFLAAIVAVPLSQSYLESVEDEESPLLDLFRHRPTAERLRQFEKDIEQASYVKAYLQPRLQLLLTRYGRAGNKRALIGRQGFLYYRPGVLHVAGPGFLDPDFIQRREREVLDAGERAIVADPRPAILAFHAALAKRGIRLVLFPMPDKAAVVSEPLHARGLPHGLPENPDFARFVSELLERGVEVFDARHSLPPGPEKPFLVQDTHWTPDFMARAAQALAAQVTGLGVLPPLPASGNALHAAPAPVARVGDLVDMLKLPDSQTFFQPQSVRVQRVLDAEDNPWQPDEGADVLLLGDSFSNIYSLEGMGWGDSAGLAPQLSLLLQRPLDQILQNDSGAFATREALAVELRSGKDRLRGKRIVIWEFASRELSVGDWKTIDWPTPPTEGAH